MASHDHSHHDDKHHGQEHKHEHDETTAVNREFWNSLASSYDTKFGRTIEQLTREIQSRKDFISVNWVDDDGDDGDEPSSSARPSDRARREVRLLDYACGTGSISRALAQYTTQCVGVDVSENMVVAYNYRAENQGLAVAEMHAYVGDLLSESGPSESLSGPQFHDFDVAAVGLGFHHFDNPELAARRLAERLRAGGVLVLVDFLPHAPHSHGDGDDANSASHTVKHHGFDEERMRAIFEQAGAGKGFAMQEMGKGFVFHGAANEGKMARRIFIARGEKE